MLQLNNQHTPLRPPNFGRNRKDGPRIVTPHELPQSVPTPQDLQEQDPASEA
jgi:hypothetical protein